MKRGNMKRAIGLALVVLFVSGLFACASEPPRKEQQDAERAYREAVDANAGDCAGIKFKSAEQALREAQDLVNAEKYDEARTHFNVARELAEEARVEALQNPDCSRAAQTDENPDVGQAVERQIDEDAVFDDPNYELKTVFFPFNSSDITSDAQQILADNATWMNRHTDAMVVVEGHCDERGAGEYNLALGERRAQTVMGYLINLGINPERLSVISYGEERPLVSESNEEAWSKNRRAQFVKKWRR